MRAFSIIFCVVLLAFVCQCQEAVLPGGVVPVDKKDYGPLELAVDDALEELSNLPEGVDYLLKDIESATRQVVAGTLFDVEFSVFAHCIDIVHCNMKLWQQPWMNSTQFTLSCNNSVNFDHTYENSYMIV